MPGTGGCGLLPHLMQVAELLACKSSLLGCLLLGVMMWLGVKAVLSQALLKGHSRI